MAEDTKKKRRSLLDYEKAKRRAACAVCSLPDALVSEVRGARTKKMPQATVLEWLREEHGITLTRSQFVAHSAAHHDQWDEEAADA